MTHDLTDKGMAAIWDDVRHNGSVPDELTKISDILEYQVLAFGDRIRDAAYERCAEVAANYTGLFDLPSPDDGPFTQMDKTVAQCNAGIAESIRSLSKPLEKENG